MGKSEVLDALRGMSKEERDEIIAAVADDSLEDDVFENFNFLEYVNDPKRLEEARELNATLTAEDRQIARERAKGPFRPFKEFIDDLRAGKFESGLPE